MQACVHDFIQAEAEMQEDAVSAGQKVLIIDDLLATGGEWTCVKCLFQYSNYY